MTSAAPTSFGDVPHPADTDDEPVSVEHPADEVRQSLAGAKQPHSLEAEREVLCAVFIDPTQAELVLHQLTPAAFYVERHQFVFAAVRDLFERGVAIDLVTVQQALKDRGQYERAGGARTLGELIDRSGTVTNLEHYIAIVRDKARLRRVIDESRAIEAEALGDVADVDAFVTYAGKRLERAFVDVAKPPELISLTTLAQRKDRGEDWFGTEPPEARLLFRHDGKPFMRTGRVSALVGKGGVGKSYAFLDLCFAVASGGLWLGTYQCEQRGKVLSAFGEEDDPEQRRRLHKVARGRDMYELYQAEQNIVPLSMMGEVASLIARAPDGGLVPSPFYHRLYASLAQHEWAALLLDPWARWGGPEVENDAYAATLGVALLESFTKLPGNPAVIVTHHSRKSTGGFVRSDADDSRGSSAFVDGCRWVANLSLRTEADAKLEVLELRVTKRNYTPASKPLNLVRGEGGALRPATAAEMAQMADAEAEAKEAKTKNRRKANELGANTL